MIELTYTEVFLTFMLGFAVASLIWIVATELDKRDERNH